MSARERLVVVGGVAAGLSAASQARRRRPDLDVVVLERGPSVAYGRCGLAYQLEAAGRSLEELVVSTPERLAAERDLDVRPDTEVIGLELARGRLWLRRPGGEGELGFDRLVLATGCRPLPPPWPGGALPGVFVLRTLEHARALQRYLPDRSLRRAVVVGGGHLGVELADVLAARGLRVSLLYRGPGLPAGYPPELSARVEAELARAGVELRPGVEVGALEGDSRVRQVVTAGGAIEADLVLVALGVQPEVTLGAAAGLRLGQSGAYEVDAGQRCSAPGVFAAGDCAEVFHLLQGRWVYLPRGTTANRQGRVAGANAAGADERAPGVVGTAVTRVCSLEVGHTGLDEHAARAAGFDPRVAFVEAHTRGRAYPGGREIAVRLVFDGPGGRVLGAHLVGGEGVAGRLGVLAAALAAGFDVDRLAGLDLAYSPPVAPAWDPLLVAAQAAQRLRAGG